MFRRKKKQEVNNVALFVDGPNIIRKEFSIDLDELRRVAQEFGRIIIGKVFLNQYASEKLIEAVSNQGFEPKIVMAGEVESDVDVGVAVEICKAAFNPGVGVIVLASRDADFLPAIQLAKEQGKTVVVVGAKSGFSKALQKSADHVKTLGNRK